MPSHLFARNAAWAADIKTRHPEFFVQLEHVQTPSYLWIGCSDSRVPPTTLMDLKPGEVFVHRNIANVVEPADTSCMAVVEFAVNALKIEHLIVGGHYGCGGCGAVSSRQALGGALGRFLRSVENVRDQHAAELKALDTVAAANRLAELNALAQARHLDECEVVRAARARGQAITVDAWVYDVGTGHLHDLGFASAAAV